MRIAKNRGYLRLENIKISKDRKESYRKREKAEKFRSVEN